MKHSRLMEHAWTEALEKIGLTPAGLIKRARVEVQTMSRTLERLEREGNVARQKHPDDGRRHIAATAADRWDSG